MSTVFEADSLEWQPLRPNMTNGVYGKIMLAEGVQAMLVRVAPGGGFPPHRDGYAHLFYFLSGEGIVRIEETTYAARPGLVVQVAAGESHGYENTGEADLTLISLNVPLP
jgi:quercetin dioxygenase-like cupin family protein